MNEYNVHTKKKSKIFTRICAQIDEYTPYKKDICIHDKQKKRKIKTVYTKITYRINQYIQK